MGKFTNLGGVTIDRELLFGSGHLILPATIDYTSQIKKILKGTLYGRQTTSKKYAPAFTLAKLASATNTTNFVGTLSVAGEAGIFTITTDTVKLWDVSAGVLVGLPSTAMALTVDAVSTSANTVTCTGEVFDCTPAAGDYLVIMDGTQDPSTFGVCLEDIDFSALTEDKITHLVMTGAVDKDRILRLYDDYTTPNALFSWTTLLQRILFYQK
jgi:hypothetical protein